ncbi:MAG: ATP-binding protein [Candidatus Nitrosopolaris sp.]
MVEIILIVGSFGVLTYFQSQQSSLGNSINIAGKNRYLTANLLLQSEKYLYGLSSDISQLKVAMNSLESNIIALKQGGMISGVDLRPLPSDFLDMWKTIDQDWNAYKTYVRQNILLIPPHQEGKVTTTSSPPTTKDTAIGQSLAKEALESMASNLVNSSDKLVTQLGQQTDKNSRNLMLLQILVAIVIVGILVLILYLVARILRPIYFLTQATSEVQKGNLDASVEQKGNDELSVLGESFNSMITSIRDFIKKQGELTKQLEATNEELKNKDRLKDEFINVAAHELRTPIQPIVGLAGFLKSQVKGDYIKHRELADSLDIISRNANRLTILSEDILDVTRIEGRSLQLTKEIISLHELLKNIVQDYDKRVNHSHINLSYEADDRIYDPIRVNADKKRLTQVIFNLVSNAVKFTQKNGGLITIRIEKEKYTGGQKVAIVSVKDSGSGIDPEILPKLFEKFASKSFQGTGLGLFISKAIVEAHEGRIWAQNNVDGKGATFSFSLPLNS